MRIEAHTDIHIKRNLRNALNVHCRSDFKYMEIKIPFKWLQNRWYKNMCDFSVSSSFKVQSMCVVSFDVMQHCIINGNGMAF